MKILFAGTPEFAAKSLAALIDSDHQIMAVLTQPDRPAGRGRKLTPSPVKQLALEHDIEVHQPISLKNQAARDLIELFVADVMIVAAYGLILPEAILDIPEYGCLNIHASLLPRWRGAAPIQRAIEAGDTKTGVTIMQMDTGLDTGDMLAKSAINIDERETAGSLHDKLADLGAELIISVLNELENGKLEPEQQDNSLATYAQKLSREESFIDWDQSARNIVNRIHAFNPWPAAKSKHNKIELKILTARIVNQTGDHKIGEIICVNKKITVQAKDGLVELLELQKPGARVVPAAEFLNGYNFAKGDRFS